MHWSVDLLLMYLTVANMYTGINGLTRLEVNFRMYPAPAEP